MSGSEYSVIKSSPYFLSTLSSKSVPENEDVTLSCKLSGNPKPQVTWFRNGQNVSEQKDISDCEILEDNLIHALHLFRCTEQHAGVYRIVATNCFGTVQSSAFLKVASSEKSEPYQKSLYSPDNNVGTCHADEVAACQWEYPNQNKEAITEESYSTHECDVSLGSLEPPTVEVSLSTEQTLGTKFSHSVECETCPPVENHHQNAVFLGDNKEVKNVPNPEEDGGIWDMSKTASDLFIYDSIEISRDTTGGEVDNSNSSQVDSKPASQRTDHTGSCCLNAEVLAACQTTEYAKTHEESGLSTSLKKGALSENHAYAPLENLTCFPKDCCKNVDHNFELRLDRNFITANEFFEDDHFERLESSDVMTEEAYRNLEKKLKFLLESDDEDELNLGSDCDGCTYFLCEMPCLFQVSDNTVPMDATIGFCGHQSKSKEVAVRSDLSAYSPSTLQTGMTLTVKQQQNKTSIMKDKEKYKLPVASIAIENDYPRIEEENGSNNHSAADFPVVQTQGIGNGLSASSSCDLGGTSATTEKRGVGRGIPRKCSQQLTKVREKLSKGKAKVSVASRTKALKDPVHLLHPKELHASETHTVQTEKRYLDSAELLHGQGGSVSSQACQDTANGSNNQTGLLHGKGREENGPWEGKWISDGLSWGDQMPNENATLMAEKKETEIESIPPISDELKLFITEPELEERFVLTSSLAKSVSMGAGNLALEKLSGRNGFQIDNTVPENSSGHYVPNGTCDVQEPCWDRTFQVTPMDYTDSHSPDALSCTTVTSKQKGLYDILTPSPIALADPHMKKGKACGEKPHDVNEVKTGSDTPCTEYLSQVDFQTALESREPEDRDADLSSMHEQLQKLLYEEEDWGYDFTCTSSEVKRLAAGTDVAKEVEGLIITGDVSAGQHVSANLTEDNQLVTELATVMNGCTDFNSLLKTDEACSRTSMGNSSLPLPVESDAMCLCSAFGHETQKPSAHLLSSSLVNAETHLWNKDSKTQPDHNRSIQMSTSQEGTIISDNVLLSCGTESPFKLKEVPNQTLEREMLSGVPTNYLGQLHYIEQDVHCTDGPIAKQADEMPAEEFHVTLCHSRIKERANLAELSVKEDSSSNFPGKNMDQFTSEEHSSVKAVDKSTKDKFQEKRTESDTKAQSGSNCGIYHVLRGNNSKDFQAESDAQNYGYYIQEHNSVIATESQVDQDGLGDSSQDNKRIKRGMQEPVFTASYKVSFLTELLLEINKDDKNDLIYEWGDLEATTKQSAPESKHVLEMAPSKSQQRGNDSSIVGFFCEMVEGLGMGSACTLSESGVSTALNTMHPSAIGNECSRNDWDSQNASNKAGNVMISTDGNQPKRVCKGDKNALVTNYSRTESIMQTELRQIEFQKDKNAQAPELQQDQCQRVKEKSKTQTAQYDREREMPMAHDIEETEVEPYMQALMDSEEQKHSGHDRTELQERNQEVEEASHTKIIPCESDAKENQKSMECDLEAAEVEPYMMALVNSREMYSWHDSINNVHPSMIPSSEQTDVSVGELVSESAAISMGHSPAGAFTACESPTLSSSEHAMGTLVSISPGASESSHHSQERLPQGKTQPCFLAATADDPCALKGERAKSQEAYRLCKPPSTHNSLEDVKRKQEIVKKKMVSKVQVKKPRLEAKENVCKNASCVKKVLKAEAGLTHKEDKREQRKLPCKKDSKAPKLLKKIQAELFSDFSGNIKLCCQFGEINEDSTITWTKDSKLLTRVQRSAGDDFPVSLAIVQAGKKDQGLYYCCLKNTYGKATAEFNLTSEVLEHLSSFQDVEELESSNEITVTIDSGQTKESLEDIEFLQLMFREDFISESYFSNSLHGRITTEELHFGEGVHRKAFRSKVMQGLVPVFSPGHPCVLKVHNAIAYGTKNNDELVKKNYKLALQECYVQNTAREYAKIYAAETKLLEGFGEVPEVIPIFLIHRPKNNIPYATVEEELIGEFVKYSIRDGKEINFMRKDSEAGQKCCTFQHWVYEKTSGSLLITDMQGVGMKLTDVGIATLAKGYKGFKGNCSISFIDQFKALHQCNKYCEMLGLKPLQASCQKQRKPAATKIKAQPSSSTAKKTVIGPQAAKKT